MYIIHGSSCAVNEETKIVYSEKNRRRIVEAEQLNKCANVHRMT